MKRSHLTWTLSALVILAAVLPAASPAAAAPSTISGRLVSLSPATRTLTVERAGGGQVMLRTTPDSNLVRNGSSVSLAALALRDSVTVRYDRSSSTVLDLRANGSSHTTVRGVLAAATPASLSVVTTSGAKAFAMSPATLIVRNGRAAHASDLRRGDALLLHAVPAAGGGALAKDVAADGPEEDEVEGSITAIAGQDVTITPKHGAAVTVHVATDTAIRICNGGCHTAALSDLAVGMDAEAEFDPISLVAEKIQAKTDDDTQALRIRGTIAAIDTTAGTVTVHPAQGSDVTVKVDAGTKISRNEAPATLADLEVGDKVQAWYDGTSMLATRLVASSADDGGDDEKPAALKQVEGKVTKVSATALTVAPERGAPVELKLDGTTKYFLRGTPATNADVKVGNRVHAAYDGTTKIAAVVRVQNNNPHPTLSNISGSVTAVSATEITIAPHHGAAATLTIDSTTVIKISGHAAAAADIQVGDGAQAKFDATTMVAKQLNVEHHGGGHGHH